METIERSKILPLVFNSPANGYIVNRPVPGTGFFADLYKELDDRNTPHFTVDDQITPEEFFLVLNQAISCSIVIIDAEHGLGLHPGVVAIIYQILLKQVVPVAPYEGAPEERTKFDGKLLIVSDPMKLPTPVNNRLVHLAI